MSVSRQNLSADFFIPTKYFRKLTFDKSRWENSLRGSIYKLSLFRFGSICTETLFKTELSTSSLNTFIETDNIIRIKESYFNHTWSEGPSPYLPTYLHTNLPIYLVELSLLIYFFEHHSSRLIFRVWTLPAWSAKTHCVVIENYVVLV